MNTDFAQKLSGYRQQKGLSQEELAQKIGVSSQTVSEWERGESSPDTDNLIALSEIYGISLDELIKGKNQHQSVFQTADSSYTESSDKSQGSKFKILSDFPYSLICVLIHCLWGMSGILGGWSYSWTIFLTIPVYYLIVSMIQKRKLITLCYPLIVVAIFLLLGFCFDLWNICWVIFLIVPFFF